jgi:hypothetical protein
LGKRLSTQAIKKGNLVTEEEAIKSIAVPVWSRSLESSVRLSTEHLPMHLLKFAFYSQTPHTTTKAFD